ncbi:SO2930 family diheme c-type cytochrome [Pseudomonas sp. NPDC077649]|uniref:SO2930 family diheme c-type cytochrome n=1 Tax=Pseudomonas sp. NPDC077649 TaxID=3364423 RepID=UPI0037C98C51
MMRGWLVIAALLLGACEQQRAPLHLPSGEDYPERLSAWGVLEQRDGRLQPAAGVLPYNLNTPLFTDYAHKLRTLWMPAGSQAQYAEARFDYPVGTVLSKTFYYPRDTQGRLLRSEQQGAEAVELKRVRLIETRILLRQEQGWVALPYVWDAAQREATLDWAGASFDLQLHDERGEVLAVDYQVPDANQCAGCHEEQAGKGVAPLGPKARQLNKDFAYAEGLANQLQRWQAAGLLQGLPRDLAEVPQNALWGEPRAGEGVQAQARSYLDANCAHCHNREGPGRTSGLYLDPDTPLGIAYGLCKQPVAAGKGSGDRLVDIHPGAPEKSVLSFRLHSTDPSIMMPELGRSSVHREGLELIDRWIASLDGEC